MDVRRPSSHPGDRSRSRLLLSAALAAGAAAVALAVHWCVPRWTAAHVASSGETAPAGGGAAGAWSADGRIAAAAPDAPPPEAGEDGVPRATDSPLPEGCVRRIVRDDLVAIFGPSRPFTLLDRQHSKPVYELPAREDTQWAVGYHALAVCQWRRGEPARVFRPPSREPQVLSWAVPEDTGALAIGDGRLALRRGTYTVFYGPDGRPTGGGPAPLWTEGVYLGDLLLLGRPAPTESARPEAWCVRFPDLEVLWTATVEDGVATFR